MRARMMMKMQVPAYWPVVAGVHLVEYNGVLVEVKRVAIMFDMGSIGEFEVDEDMLITTYAKAKSQDRNIKKGKKPYTWEKMVYNRWWHRAIKLFVLSR